MAFVIALGYYEEQILHLASKKLETFYFALLTRYFSGTDCSSIDFASYLSVHYHSLSYNSVASLREVLTLEPSFYLSA